MFQPLGQTASELQWWPGATPALFAPADIARVADRIREPIFVVQDRASGHMGLATGGAVEQGPVAQGTLRLIASLPAAWPEWLGDRGFLAAHRLRFPYVAGAMANGIATPEMVIAMGKAGMLGFFGAAGMGPEQARQGLQIISQALGPDISWGSNLIHAPNEPDIEWAIADLYARTGVRRVSASAYMKLTPAIVYYSASGLRVGPSGEVHRQNNVFAKVSRPEVARHFMEPPPEAMLRELVARGAITEHEARIAATLPVAEDFTVEADSGGHTDNQALPALFPTLMRQRDDITAAQGYTRAIRLGAAGGLGTPAAVAAAFTLGAAYVLTGSVNQSALESGLHPQGKKLLCQAGIADVIMAPAADMFELGVEVQVLSRGTMFAGRAKRLYQLYKDSPSLDAITGEARARLEGDILKDTVEGAWLKTRDYWAARDPRELARAQAEPKHKMALVFRAYLGQSSKWAIHGDTARAMDHQIWCGPAMGAFNAWVKGSFLEAPERRGVVQIARNLLEGAAVVSRAQQLRALGVPIPPKSFDFTPRPLS